MAMPCRILLLLAGSAVAAGVSIAGLQYPYLCLMIVGASSWRRMTAWRGSGSSHGTARLANLLHLAGMIGREDGLILGRASLAGPPSRWHAFRCLISPRISSALACRLAFASLRRRGDRGLLRVRDYVHLLTVAPAGAGKSVASIIPNLLSFSGSAVVVDPKGELYKATAEFRRKVLGHKIVRLDPFGIAGPAEESDALNPLDFIDQADPGFLDEVRSVADMLVVRKGTEPDPHWNDWAVVILAAFMAFVCGCEPDAEKRNLGLVRDIVCSRHVYTEAVAAMRQVPGYGGVIAKFGELLGWLVDRELGSVLSSVQRHSAWMDSPAVAACLKRSSFDPRWLRAGRVTVYLILPHDKLTTLAPLMRVWLGTILRAVTKHGATEKNPVLFIIDEAAHIGHMKAIQDGLSLMRGYGIRIWLFFQSLDQLKTTYGEHAGGMLDNLGTQQYFGINSFETADHLSKRIGDATILSESMNYSHSRSRASSKMPQEGGGSVSTSRGFNIGEQGRRVIRPEEILVLHDSVSLVFHRNLPPIAAELVRFFEAPEFARGRGGRDRGVGIGGLAASLLILAVSLGFFGLMRALPSPGTLRQVAIDMPPRRGRMSPLRDRDESAASSRLTAPQLPWFTPRAKPEPEIGWDFQGHTWIVRPDGGHELIEGPPRRFR